LLGLESQQNSKHQGDVGFALAIAWFTQNGYHVSIPLTDSRDYDLIVEKDYKLQTVQVRTTYYQRYPGIYQLSLTVSGGNRTGEGRVKFLDPDRVDFLFAVTDRGDKYLFPTREVLAKSTLNLGEKYEIYKVN